MKVLLQSIGGVEFSVEVGDSCTLQELKEKVHEKLGISIAGQILSFNGNILCEDSNLVDVENGSVIKFRIAPQPKAEVMDLQLDISETVKITVESCGDDTVYELKEKIQKKEGTPPNQILLTTEDMTELPNHKRLRDCDLKSGVKLEFLPEPRRKWSRLLMSPPRPAPSVDADVLSLELQFMGEKLPAPVEVRRKGLVKELRRKLEAMKFKVTGINGHVFFHNNVMLDEYRCFGSQNVEDGDLVTIHAPGCTYTLKSVS